MLVIHSTNLIIGHGIYKVNTKQHFFIPFLPVYFIVPFIFFFFSLLFVVFLWFL